MLSIYHLSYFLDWIIFFCRIYLLNGHADVARISVIPGERRKDFLVKKMPPLYAHIYVFAHIYLVTYKRTLAYAYTHMYASIYAHICIHIFIYPCIHTRIYTFVQILHECIHIYVHDVCSCFIIKHTCSEIHESVCPCPKLFQ